MLDIRLIRENPQEVKDRLTARAGGAAVAALIDDVLACDESRRQAETEKQRLQSERNRLSKEIGQRKRAGEDTSETEALVKGFASELADWETAAERARSFSRAA